MRNLVSLLVVLASARAQCTATHVWLLLYKYNHIFGGRNIVWLYIYIYIYTCIIYIYIDR